MQKLKSLFISLFCSYLVVAFLYSLVRHVQTGGYSELFSAFSHLLGAAFFTSLFVMKTARTSIYLPGWSLPIFVAGTLTLYFSVLESNHAGLVLTLIVWSGWLLYLLWYSSFGKSGKRLLTLATPLPGFTLVDSTGESFSNKDLSGQYTLLMFFRGNWCPLCMAQVREVAEQYRTLVELGVQVCLISPQPEANTQKLSLQFDVPFTFLMDERLQTAEAFGITVKNGTPTGLEVLGYDSDTVRPTVLITDKEGKLVYSDITNNYRVRPEPEAFISILKELQLTA